MSRRPPGPHSSIRFQVRVHPGAHRTVVGGRHGPDGAPALVVRVTAPAVDGRANRALVDALAEAFAVRKRAVTIVTGANSRTKLVEVAGVDQAAVAALLDAVPSERSAKYAK